MTGQDLGLVFRLAGSAQVPRWMSVSTGASQARASSLVPKGAGAEHTATACQ